ncbi:RhuM family protein [Syntrophus sp. (in: bacteria)]|jgi:hypothetical protein|uniref:RhuM family protein n=1 Tax=Syntrophus sp. (in: bacteria) TaxID=48412 RepID=UPI00345E2ED8
MSEVILYTTDDGATKIDLRFEDGTVWLTQLELAELFQTSKQNISKHIKAIFDDQELSESATVNQKLTVQNEGGRGVSRRLILNNLVSAYFDLAELNAIEEREMRMADYVRELDNILSSTGRELLDHAGSISHTQAANKARLEYKKYKAKTLANVEQDYLKTIAKLEKQAKEESRKK